jgi:hypothetical protein
LPVDRSSKALSAFRRLLELVSVKRWLASPVCLDQSQEQETRFRLTASMHGAQMCRCITLLFETDAVCAELPGADWLASEVRRAAPRVPGCKSHRPRLEMHCESILECKETFQK